MTVDERFFEGNFPPGENIQDLYIGWFDAKPGTIKTDKGTFPASWWGEILVYADADEEDVTIRQLRRVAMYGQLNNPDDDPRIGVISLSSTISPYEATIGKQNASDFQLQLHYAALTDLDQQEDDEYLYDEEYLDDKAQETHGEDYFFPQVEQIRATLSWQVENRESQEFTLWVEDLSAKELTEPILAVVEQVSLEPRNIVFELAGTGHQRSEPTYSLPSNCPPGPSDCPPGVTDVVRILPIRFINSSSATLADNDVQNSGKSLEDICKEQIGGVCKVWRDKSCLDVDIVQEIISGDPDFAVCGPLAEVTIKHSGFAHLDEIEIYLVDRLVRWPNGGVTHNANQASAYCILATERMVENPYLLAHELSHVMGLADFGKSGTVVGERDTVAHPGRPNPQAPEDFWQENQSWHNLQIFTDPTISLNSKVRTTAIPDCFRPDF